MIDLARDLKRRFALRFLRPFRLRRAVARRHLARGIGIELGPLHLPLVPPRGARVFNVDYLTHDALRARYPELGKVGLAPVHLVDSAERLESIRDGSLDFVVASHVIEHMEDPIAAVGAWLRVLRAGGTALVIAPDRRHTFDRDRAPTPWEHLVADHEDGGEASRRGHYEEWAEKVDRVPAEKRAASVERMLASRYSIHFHVWGPTELDDFLERARALVPAFAVRFARDANGEMIRVLERR